MEEDLKQYIERATDILVEFSKKEKDHLKPPEQAAKELLESEKNLKTVESKFQTNSIDVVYHYLKEKYPEEAANDNVEKMLTVLKSIAGKEDKKSLDKIRLVYTQLIAEMKTIEDRIQSQYPEYIKKFN